MAVHRLLKWTAALLAAGALLLWPEATFDGHRTFAESRAAKDNLHLLAQVVCGEARGEPYEGKVAVAAVILNRTLDNRFPDSVAGVVYQTHAFESVSNGEIYKETTEECFKAARAALAGWDPSNGALYFFAPAKTSNAFIWSREQVRTIGKHIFAK
ncbi:MAG: spore cortex-lytic protein [Symbiobacterium thermophilum]|uniref:Spore cortex-lytic protein n=1 Tax=Symbiobacterium thermophilum TaxID=2734 RepID=A0A953IA42_SYMTR|nr:spore cortex-lytic protein [Symbiobacterium thermophilum]